MVSKENQVRILHGYFLKVQFAIKFEYCWWRDVPVDAALGQIAAERTYVKQIFIGKTVWI
jgi:glutamate synthase domain-containing protein 1